MKQRILFNQLSANAITLVQAWNRSLERDRVQSVRENMEFNSLGKEEVAECISEILKGCTFHPETINFIGTTDELKEQMDREKACKQTYKRSVTRQFRTAFSGYALIVKGNKASSYLLKEDETTGEKGEVINLTAKQAKQAKNQEDKDKKETALLLAEQVQIELDHTKTLLSQSYNTQGSLTKEVRQLQHAAKNKDEIITRLEQERDNLLTKVEQLKLESSLNIEAYNRLKVAVLDSAVPRKQLIAMV